MDRPVSSVRRKLNEMGISLRKTWTKEEKDIIKEKYPFIGTECVKFLPNKSINAIRMFAFFNNIKMKEENRRKSKYKYVCWNKTRNKWVVGFEVDGRRCHFGYYDDEDKAGKVALEKAKEYGKI